MSNVSIFEKNWIDLVFEGKNQKYGAYQLRQESPRTTAIAFIFGLLFLSLLFGIIFTLSSFGETPVVKPDDGPVIVCNYHVVKPNLPKKNDAFPVKKTKDDVKKNDLNNLVVANKDDNPVDVVRNKEMKENSTTSDDGKAGGAGTPGLGTNVGPSKETGIPSDNGENKEIVISALLDKQPSFPNGIDGFYKYISNNFQRPEMDEPQTIRVIVSFVIEKDGSMTNISVLQNPGFGMDKEAIRVLKSLKTKWNPGIKDGQPMRTQFTLPIALKTE